ncbi:Xaa-Pro dipeptidyl-peptidase [Ligilactobacillus salitolerans]|uniref:Xaa-Pro dipeptidyl-peptidase n=1 Tax=Ligilactobacillus salitolerans TaxID=1808352 RepID=A0A401IU68_9LACO|nr:Xaa-Pro dipeptidyl-peptidase [Ligilactobacillus salitolerans]GBG95055.1 Xaa-Pro dipeptidyl-peptidase [Ligilactobacillus salitolerans]
MKFNQYSGVSTPYRQQVAELQEISYLDQLVTPQTDLNELWLSFLSKSFPQAKSQAVLRQQIGNILASATQNVWDFTAEHTVDAAAFYTVGLQLLGFTCGDDFQIAAPLEALKDFNLFYHPQISEVTDLIAAWYDLLNTRGKNGQILLDTLASQGYFLALTDLPASQKPLLFNGKSQPVFNTDELIREVVYIESSLDTDHDGQLDLLKAEILRPQDTNAGLKVPAVYTASPYNQGTNDEAGDKMMHNVDTPLTRKKPNELTYADIEYHAPETKLPPKRKVQGQAQQAEESFAREQSYTLNDYLAARGFAIVYAAGIGTRGSQGVRTCGDPAETASTIAIIEWLAGNRRAFTNRTDNIEIKAWWCNGSVAMTGRSYLGTLATAAATTGVDGLKTIISEAAISNWYDYYRENGLVVAPGGFPGEDADVLAEECFSRQLDGADYLQAKETFAQQLAEITAGQDRKTGDYNEFWDARNYLKNVHNIKCDVLMVHGLNDWNVKPRNVYNLYNALADLPVARKLILHQGQHIYINAFRSLDYSEMINLWLTHELYAVDNGAEKLLPDVLVQDNVQPETWHEYPDWEQTATLSRELFLAPEKLTLTKAAAKHCLSFQDHLPEPDLKKFRQSETAWQAELLDQNSKVMANNRLIFKTEPLTEELVVRGAAHLKLKASASLDHGLLSVMLVDYGQAKRLGVIPAILGCKSISSGYHWREDDLNEFQLTKPTPCKMISKAHINLQNRTAAYRTDDLIPGEFYDLEFDLQPTFYRLPADHQLGLVVYSTDMGMTVRGNEDNTYQLDLAGCSLTFNATQTSK